MPNTVFLRISWCFDFVCGYCIEQYDILDVPPICSWKHAFIDLVSKGWMIHFICSHSKSSCNSCVADCSRKWLLLHENYWHWWSRESVSEVVVVHFTDLDMKLVIIKSTLTSRYFLDCINDGDNFEMFLLNSKCFGNTVIWIKTVIIAILVHSMKASWGAALCMWILA